MSEIEPDAPDCCKVCGSDMQWEHCWNCGGEGEFDGYEEDPNWYAPGETYMCDICLGEGGWRICLNVENHPKEAANA